MPAMGGGAREQQSSHVTRGCFRSSSGWDLTIAVADESRVEMPGMRAAYLSSGY
jgi:hypothetical protein